MDRSFSLTVAGRALDLPCFLPSISTVKTNLAPLDYLQILVAGGCPALLISAYDIDHAIPEQRVEISGLLDRCQKAGQVVVLDSGKYESYWKGDHSWTRERFHSVLERYAVPLAFSFDNQAPPRDPIAAAKEVLSSATMSQGHGGCTILPIIHCGPDALLQATYEVGRVLRPLMMAVPERILGNGVLVRAKAVAAVRGILNQLDYYCPLHLLGTGNPLSILIYALSGADSFDGLEWCQTVVDHDTGLLFHFQHWDLFAAQTVVNALTNVPYSQKVLAHNLLFYTKWMAEVRNSLRDGKGSTLCHRRLCRVLPGKAVDLVFRELAGIL